MPKVSIIAPVYGVENYLEQFLESIQNQNFKDLEVILVDDGSPDRCPLLLDEFANEDNRYKVIHQKNSGVSVARNTGLENATGEYVYIVDSDDWLHPNCIEKLYMAAIDTKADIIYGNWIQEKVNESKLLRCFPHEFVSDDLDTIQALQCAILTNSYSVKIQRPEFEYVNYFGGAPWRALIRKEIIDNNQLKFDPYVRGLGDDILFSLHLYEHVKRVAYIDEAIYHYRKIDASYSHGYKANYLETVDRIFDRLQAFLHGECTNERLIDFYNFRVLLYLEQGMERYFKNIDNPKSSSERFKEFKNTVKSEPYISAIKNMKLSVVINRKRRYSFKLLQKRLYRAYWILEK